jgi:hypothetical protein
MFFHPDGDVLASAKACEADVFLQTYGNTAEQLTDEYGPYESAAVFIAVADESGDVIATVRLLAPSPAGLKIFHDIEREPWSVDAAEVQRRAHIDPSRAWEIATLSVRRGLKGHAMLAAAAMYHGIIETVYANDVGTVLMVMDRRARTLLNSVSLIQHALPGTGPQPYLGSAASTPLYAHCPEIMDNQRRLNPEAHRLITLGVGMDGIAIPARAEFRLDRKPRELALVV